MRNTGSRSARGGSGSDSRAFGTLINADGISRGLTRMYADNRLILYTFFCAFLLWLTVSIFAVDKRLSLISCAYLTRRFLEPLS